MKEYLNSVRWRKLKGGLWLLLFVAYFQQGYGQVKITGLSTVWADSFSEWVIYTDDEESTGELSQRWLAENDWTEWVFNVGDIRGQIKIKWKDDPNQWELRSAGEVITIRTVWNNDPSRWRITDNEHSYTMVSRFYPPREWKLQETQHGDFEVFMTHEPDPRDWDVYDSLDDEVSLPVKMAMIFITVFHSTPKW